MQVNMRSVAMRHAPAGQAFKLCPGVPHNRNRLMRPVLTASPSLDVAQTQTAESLIANSNRQQEQQHQQQQDLNQHEQQQHQPPGSFSWTKQWWPVAPVSYLDPNKPYPVTMLGHTYVVWFDPTAQQWRVMDDRCPHRLAPLSEGRIDEKNGTLMCSYHGWEFNGRGACTRIPQVGDPDKMSVACASPRACVTSYPTRIMDGLIYTWLEAGPQAEEEAAANPPYSMPEGGGALWHLTVVPTDYCFWLEQGMDPAHANFLHHTCGFPMSDAVPMPGETLTADDVDLNKGFTWTHGNYSKKNAGMTATRQFVPPYNLRVVYDKGFVKGFNTMGVPVQPGVSRVFGRFVFAPPAGKTPLMFKLMAKLPHWARVGQSPLADQDTVMNAKQEFLMRSQGFGPKDYSAFARADQGVMAAHKWFDMAGYEDMWKQRLGQNYSSDCGISGTSSESASDSSSGGTHGVAVKYTAKKYTPRTEADYFNWYERHTKHCRICQKGMKQLEQAANALKVLAVLLVVVAASLSVAAKTVASPGVVVAGLLAAGCLWLKQKVWDYRQVAFIDSSFRWQKDGGLSLVKGDPIRLY